MIFSQASLRFAALLGMFGLVPTVAGQAAAQQTAAAQTTTAHTTTAQTTASDAGNAPGTTGTNAGGLDHAMPPMPNEIGAAIDYLGFNGTQFGRIMSGEIASVDLPRGSDRELAVALSVLIPAPLETALDALLKHDGPTQIVGMVEYRFLDPETASVDDFERIRLDQEDMPDLTDYVDAMPGDIVNLSPSEIAEFRQIGDAMGAELDGGDNSRLTDRASALLQEMLFERFSAYTTQGHKALAPYARASGATVEPGVEIETAVSGEEEIFDRFRPDLLKAVRDYPTVDRSHWDDLHYWVKTEIEGRQNVRLTHTMIYRDPAFALVQRREYYVAHTYNTLNSLAALVPYGDGTLLLYVNRTSTDQVDGFPLSVRHSIGRSRLRERLTSDLQPILDEIGG